MGRFPGRKRSRVGAGAGAGKHPPAYAAMEKLKTMFARSAHVQTFPKLGMAPSGKPKIDFVQVLSFAARMQYDLPRCVPAQACTGRRC
jgi:hypothetical protein